MGRLFWVTLHNLFVAIEHWQRIEKNEDNNCGRYDEKCYSWSNSLSNSGASQTLWLNLLADYSRFFDFQAINYIIFIHDCKCSIPTKKSNFPCTLFPDVWSVISSHCRRHSIYTFQAIHWQMWSLENLIVVDIIAGRYCVDQKGMIEKSNGFSANCRDHP